MVYSRTASTCSLVTPGNHNKKSSIEAPPSRFSNSAATSTRVSRKIHEPLTFSGSRSTTGHEDQSIMSEPYYPQSDEGKNRADCDALTRGTLVSLEPLHILFASKPKRRRHPMRPACATGLHPKGWSRSVVTKPLLEVSHVTRQWDVAPVLLHLNAIEGDICYLYPPGGVRFFPAMLRCS